MVPAATASDSSAKRLERLQALLLLDSAERRRELERLRADDPSTGAALDDLLAHDAEALADGFLSGTRPPPADALPHGARLGPYEIDRLLGRGGMGTVYLANRREPYRQTVAIKRIRPGLSERLTARFHAERQILATLVHPGIVRLIDGGADADGSPYLVMEYVDGAPLDRYCRDRATTLDERVRLVADVAEALAYAHAQGIVHRDLKPSNILVGDDGRPRVTDFGLAKHAATASAALTETGLLLGTPSYMAPERLTLGPGRDEPGVDVYALGVILYSLAVGRLPFESGDVLAGCAKAVREDAPPLRRAVPSVPRDLETIAARALARDPRDRFADAGAMAEQLRRRLDGKPLTIRPPTVPDRLSRWAARHRRPLTAWAASFALALLVMIGTLAAWNRSLRRDQDALRSTMRSLWRTSTRLAEVLPPGDASADAFFDELARSFEAVREQGLIAADPSLDRQVAVMHRQHAAKLDGAANVTEAIAALDRSISLLRPLPGRTVDPEMRAWTEFDLFRSLILRVSVLQKRGRLDDAMTDSDEAVRIIRGLVDRVPNDPAWLEALARHLIVRVSILGKQGRWEEARREAAESLEAAERGVRLAGAGADAVKINTLLMAITVRGETAATPDEKERFYREACERAEALPDESWTTDSLRVHARALLGSLLVGRGRHAEALPLYTRSLETLEKNVARFPESREFRLYRNRIARAVAVCREGRGVLETEPPP